MCLVRVCVCFLLTVSLRPCNGAWGSKGLKGRAVQLPALESKERENRREATQDHPISGPSPPRLQCPYAVPCHQVPLQQTYCHKKQLSPSPRTWTVSIHLTFSAGVQSPATRSHSCIFTQLVHTCPLAIRRTLRPLFASHSVPVCSPLSPSPKAALRHLCIQSRASWHPPGRSTAGRNSMH